MLVVVDTKAKVAVGPYCRHGRCRSRTPVKAADHDLHPEAKLVPLGILEVDSGQLFLSLGRSVETSDFIADGIEDWWLARHAAHRGVRKIVIDLDNGPNVQSHRTQFMKRLIEYLRAREANRQTGLRRLVKASATLPDTSALERGD